MLDAGSIAIATAISCIATPAALIRAGRATVELVMLRTSPTGEALRHAFDPVLEEPLPESMQDLLGRLD